MASKRFGVNVTRTIKFEQTVIVTARNGDEAKDKIQTQFDDGNAGIVKLDWTGSKKAFKDNENIDSVEEFIEVDDAFEYED